MTAEETRIAKLLHDSAKEFHATEGGGLPDDWKEFDDLKFCNQMRYYYVAKTIIADREKTK